MIEDLILAAIPIGFILITYLMYADHNSNIDVRACAVYSMLLGLQGGIFFRLDLNVAATLTFINAFVWVLLGLKK
jgi:hypothetical protein